MREINDALVNIMGVYITESTDNEFSLEQATRMVRLTLSAYKALNICLKDMTGKV